MQLKNLFISSCVVIASLSVQVVNAATVYCPTQIICDKNYKCHIDGNNGGDWTPVPIDFAGQYRFTSALQTPSYIICSYENFENGQTQISTPQHTYYPDFLVIGNGWKQNWFLVACGKDSSSFDPKSCPFSTTPTPPRKNQL